MNFLDYILAQDSIPQTITTSYGDDEQTVPQDYAQAVCDGFMKLGLRGTSVMFSSGDSGVGGGNCLSNDGKNTKQFLPDFPASCTRFDPLFPFSFILSKSGPYVTTVGGTNGTSPEQAVYFSGGGFSNYFTQPSYQSGAVSGFLNAIGTQYSGLFK